MRLFFILILTTLSYAQVATITDHFNFYSVNESDIRRLGHGNAGLADASSFLNLLENPGLFYHSNSYEVHAGMSLKSEIDFAFGAIFEGENPNTRFDLFYPITPSLNAVLSYQQSRNLFWVQPEIVLPDGDGGFLVVKPTIDMSNSTIAIASSYKISDDLSAGMNVKLHRSELIDDLIVLKPVKTTDNAVTVSLGMHYQFNKDLKLGIVYESGFTTNHKDSLIEDERIYFFNYKNYTATRVAAGLSYTIDDETFLSVDILSSFPKTQSGLFKSVVLDYRIGLTLLTENDYSIQVGSFSSTDARDNSNDDWLEEEGFYTQRFLTAGISYFLGNLTINASFATSEIISGKQSSQSRYGVSTVFKF